MIARIQDRVLCGQAEPRWFVGMMSGTSFDAIDVAALRTDGAVIFEHGPTRTFKFEPVLRSQLATTMGRETASPEVVEAVTLAHANAAQVFLGEHAGGCGVAALGFHGQTILHRPDRRLSVQIGDPAALARAIDLPVVSRFRQHDMAAGGQGAPIAPIYHRQALSGGPIPVAQVNIGGVSNVTWTDGKNMVAFDCGPGNARIDDWMGRVGLAMDEDGAHALAGVVDEKIAASALEAPFFARRPPKSLDRNDLMFEAIDALSLEDGAATLAAITADAIAFASIWFPKPPRRWVVGGGGRSNEAIMRRLRARLGPAVLSAEDVGQDGDAVEAYMIAYLAARRFAGLPSTFPTTTGASEPTVAGDLFYAGAER